MTCIGEKEVKLAGTDKDRRRKLTQQQKDEIASLRGVISQRKCALLYNVSRRTIDFIWNPERHERNKQLRQERGGSKIYYDRTRHREAIRELRRYKREIYLKEKNIASV